MFAGLVANPSLNIFGRPKLFRVPDHHDDPLILADQHTIPQRTPERTNGCGTTVSRYVKHQQIVKLLPSQTEP